MMKLNITQLALALLKYVYEWVLSVLLCIWAMALVLSPLALLKASTLLLGPTSRLKIYEDQIRC